MQSVANANKSLEGQLKRIGELESMLNILAEEKMNWPGNNKMPEPVKLIKIISKRPLKAFCYW